MYFWQFDGWIFGRLAGQVTSGGTIRSVYEHWTRSTNVPDIDMHATRLRYGLLGSMAATASEICASYRVPLIVTVLFAIVYFGFQLIFYAVTPTIEISCGVSFNFWFSWQHKYTYLPLYIPKIPTSQANRGIGKRMRTMTRATLN